MAVERVGELDPAARHEGRRRRRPPTSTSSATSWPGLSTRRRSWPSHHLAGQHGRGGTAARREEPALGQQGVEADLRHGGEPYRPHVGALGGAAQPQRPRPACRRGRSSRPSLRGRRSGAAPLPSAAVARLPIPKRFRSPRDSPWQLVLTVAVQIGREGTERWNRLSERERSEVVRILKKSKARRSNLSERERRRPARDRLQGARPRAPVAPPAVRAPSPAATVRDFTDRPRLPAHHGRAMTAFRLISLPAHGAIELMLGVAVMVAALGLGLDGRRHGDLLRLRRGPAPAWRWRPPIGVCPRRCIRTSISRWSSVTAVAAAALAVAGGVGAAVLLTVAGAGAARARLGHALLGAGLTAHDLPSIDHKSEHIAAPLLPRNGPPTPAGRFAFPGGRLRGGADAQVPASAAADR